MATLLRRPTSQIVLPLLAVFAYSLAAFFLAFRLSTPSDAARLTLGSQLSETTSVTISPFTDQRNRLLSGDNVIRLSGRNISDWMRGIVNPVASNAGWTFGDTIDYTILRHGAVVHVPVTMERFPLAALLRENAPITLFLLVMQIQAIWMWWQQRGETATQTLLLAASAFVSFSLCWYVGMDLAAMINNRGLLLAYRLITFVHLMLLCASLIHFAMVLPNRDSQVIYSRGRIALIYLIPYPLYFCYVMLSYTPDMLTWLRRWELGAIGLVFLAFIVTMFALLRGYRRATTPKQREVVRVVVGGFGVAILIATLLGVAPMLTTGRLALDWQIVPLLSLPVALGFGIAVVFYGLFDIRIVIQRTLVWGTLTALIVVVYVLVVGALSSVFQTRSSPVFSLIATGIVAILFASVRARLQHSVNWMLYGERDNPYQVITQLSHRLEQSLSPNEALTQIVTSVAAALKLPYAAVELCQNGQYTHMASWGKAVDECIEYPLTYGGETVGRLLVAPRSPGETLTNGDHQLLTGLLYHAEAVIQAARLTADLQRSRENLVLTREEERRRLHRDLHDGLGPTLASLRLQVDTARNILKGNPAEVDPMLVDIKTQLGDALADIRRLINDLRPPALDQLGLCTAIREKARELGQASGLRITVEIPSNLPTLSAAAEVALYRICMEALTNVIKHAGATACVVRLSSNHSLKLEVIDNGHGLPEVVQRGVGLNSMMERASELGGSCVIEPGEDGGTRVFAQLPLIKLINQEEH